ncbi:hypothetical protein FHW12_003956 [Dokdonella fugitiva]|uniref:FG-GAP repeat protein n=1 Tax=Dokdonella fugitiva TaxID=328517 RepID=A0A839F7J3_9GAMM|nr:hypothetical protein [Dokdonella fugitiva]MBA8889709.1 hypothetical protein [Dokdonella fugitiva]
MAIRGRAALLGSVVLCLCGPAIAGIAYDAVRVEAPYRGYPANVYGFVPVPGATDVAASMLLAGQATAMGTSWYSTLGYLGGALGPTAEVAPPLMGDVPVGGVDVAATPEPIVVVAGTRPDDDRLALRVFAGNPLAPRSSRWLTPDDQVMAVALTRVASADDVDVAVGGSAGVGLFRGQATSPAWRYDGSAYALAHLPAAGAQPDRLVVGGYGQVDIRATSDGHVLWSWTDAGARKVLVGNIAGSAAPEFVVLGSDYSVIAFNADVPALRWRKLDVSASDIALGDRNGDGVMEVLVATIDGHTFWLDGSGAQVGASVALQHSDPRVAVAKVDAARARALVLGSSYDGGGIDVRSLDLTTSVSTVDAQGGPFDRLLIGDTDGDGHDELVSLADIPFGYPTNVGYSGRVSIRDLDTHALRWRSAIPAGLGPTGSDPLVDVAIGHVQPGAGRQLVVLGRDAAGGSYDSVLEIVDGATHALLRRALVPLAGRIATHVRLTDLDGDGIDEIVLVSEPGSGVLNGTRVHVLRADTLASLWTSPVLTPAWGASAAFLRPVAGGPPHLMFAVPQAGLWSIDLANHLVDYSVPVSGKSIALLPNGRIAVLDFGTPTLVVLDATDGTELDRLSMPDAAYSAIAALPGDADRVAVAVGDHLQTWNLAEHQPEGPSPVVGPDLAARGTLLAHAGANGTTLYAGNSIGIWAFPTRPYASLIFADGFEP